MIMKSEHLKRASMHTKSLLRKKAFFRLSSTLQTSCFDNVSPRSYLFSGLLGTSSERSKIPNCLLKSCIISVMIVSNHKQLWSSRGPASGDIHVHRSGVLSNKKGSSGSTVSVSICHRSDKLLQILFSKEV